MDTIELNNLVNEVCAATTDRGKRLWERVRWRKGYMVDGQLHPAVSLSKLEIRAQLVVMLEELEAMLDIG